MMHGTRQHFRYFECIRCGTVQISQIPGSLGEFYPDDYYSYDGSEKLRGLSRVLRAATAPMIALAMRAGLDGEPVMRRLGHHRWLWHSGISFTSSILDVGCGAGALLRSLRAEGFRSLTGIDPFLPSDVVTDGLRILNESIGEHQGAYDLVMMNHSLEHVPNPAETLAHARRLLRPKGRVLIRIPLADSEAFRRYRANWVQLDPPRHLHLFTRASFTYLAWQQGLRIVRSGDDSTAFQFWASDLYERDVPLQATRSRGLLFTHPRTKKFKAYERLSDALNRERLGDQGWFILAYDPR